MEVSGSSSRAAHLPVLDAVRGWAILVVFALHAVMVSFGKDQPAWTGWHRDWQMPLSSWLLLPAYLGWMGVPMFFVVSGFCIHWSHAKSNEKGFRLFFLRRFFRIYPPYLLALLVFALWFPWTRLAFGSRHDIDQMVGHLLLIHNNLGPAFLFGVNGSFWSIGVEAQLYLLYPLLLLGVRRLGWGRTLWLIGGLEILMRSVLGLLSWHPAAAAWLMGDPFLYWFSWSIGARLADDWMRLRPLFLARCPLWFWPALVLVGYFVRYLSGFDFLLGALATTTFLAAHLSREQGKAKTSTWRSWPARMGKISYSAYLLHQPLLLLAAAMARAFHPYRPGPWLVLAGCALSLPFILLISWGFHRLVERPSVALGRWVVGWGGAGEASHNPVYPEKCKIAKSALGL